MPRSDRSRRGDEQLPCRPRRGPVRRWGRVLCALAALACSSGAGAADWVSLGLGVDPLRVAGGAGDLLIAGRNAAPLNFYVHLNVLPRLRLETSAAFFHVTRDGAHTPPGGSSYDFTTTAVGVGAAYYFALPAPFGFYVGGRVTLARFSGNFTDKPLALNAPKETMMDVFLAPVLGAEVALSRRLFLGTELQLPLAVGRDGSSRMAAGTSAGGAHLGANTIAFLRFLVF